MILFLGSGISLSSGLPTVGDIQDCLLDDNAPTRIKVFFEELIKLDENYLIKSAPFKRSDGTYGYTGQLFREKTTYEDLFYLTDQIIINAVGLRANVTIETFVEVIRKRCRKVLNGRRIEDQLIDLHKLAKEAKSYIESKVFSLLYKATSEINGLDLILELAKSTYLSNLNIVTLNHDTLVEQILINENISFSDGFGAPDGDIRYFEDSFSSENKIKIIKLHGSISWWKQNSSKIIQPKDITDKSPHLWKAKSNNRVLDVSSTPSFLTGINKIYSYNMGIYADHNYQFLHLLRNENIMLMSGYGWGDIPLNNQLKNWFNRDKKNTLVLLHKKNKNMDEINLYYSSLEFREIYKAYLKNKQIIHIDKWLSEVTLSEIEEYFNY